MLNGLQNHREYFNSVETNERDPQVEVGERQINKCSYSYIV